MAMSSKQHHDFQVDLTRSRASWGWKIKVKRAVWQYIVQPFFKRLPRWANGTRILCLRMMGAQIGSRCLVEPKVDVLMPWNLFLSAYVAIGREVNIYNYAPVRIGGMTVISQYSFLCTGSHDYTHPHMPLVWEPIEIGSECWVAADVFIAPGVKISDGAVIGARSVVMKDMPPWTVCGGNPCRPIKSRVLKKI